jgi:uncharacterized oxidoreductase
MPTVLAPGLTQLVSAVFMAYGADETVARIVAESLVLSNLKGHDSHGVIRVADYVSVVERGLIFPNAKPEILRETESLLLVDGNWGFGQVVGRTATEWAIPKAKGSGVCVLTIRHCGHLGRIGEWAEMAAEAGLVSLSFSNGAGGGILVAPHGGRERRLSANPIAGGAPLPNDEPLIMDFATSTVAEGKIRVARRKRESLPAGMIVDANGNPSTDPEAFYGAPPGALLPFGGHKGFALSLFTDILSGALSGGGCSRPGSGFTGNAMTSILLDPEELSGTDFYEAEVDALTQSVRSCPVASGVEAVLLPGDPERQQEAKRSRSGISIDEETWSQITSLAAAKDISL